MKFWDNQIETVKDLAKQPPGADWLLYQCTRGCESEEGYRLECSHDDKLCLKLLDQPRLLGKAVGDASGLMGEASNVSRRQKNEASRLVPFQISRCRFPSRCSSRHPCRVFCPGRFPSPSYPLQVSSSNTGDFGFHRGLLLILDLGGTCRYLRRLTFMLNQLGRFTQCHLTDGTFLNNDQR